MPPLKIILFRSLRWQHWLRAFVFYEDNQEFCGLARARVLADDVDVGRRFIEALSRPKRFFLAAPHLHDDRALQHIHKHVCVMPVD
jgi:hypothetical protein